MKFELEIARARLSSISHPCPDTPSTQRINDIRIAAYRKRARIASDEMIKDGIEKQSMPVLSAKLGELMLILAENCASIGLNPDTPDFLCAARELIWDARLVVDRGLLAQEWDQVRVGTCMLEIACRGIAACLDVPYEDLVKAAARSDAKP